jgi:hypothetical protein
MSLSRFALLCGALVAAPLAVACGSSEDAEPAGPASLSGTVDIKSYSGLDNPIVVAETPSGKNFLGRIRTTGAFVIAVPGGEPYHLFIANATRSGAYRAYSDILWGVNNARWGTIPQGKTLVKLGRVSLGASSSKVSIKCEEKCTTGSGDLDEEEEKEEEEEEESDAGISSSGGNCNGGNCGGGSSSGGGGGGSSCEVCEEGSGANPPPPKPPSKCSGEELEDDDDDSDSNGKPCDKDKKVPRKPCGGGGSSSGGSSSGGSSSGGSSSGGSSSGGSSSGGSPSGTCQVNADCPSSEECFESKCIEILK